MQKLCLTTSFLCILQAGLSQFTHSGITFGDANTDLGALTVGGTLRLNYQNKDYVQPSGGDDKINFNAAILKLSYDAKNWFGQAEYRCYQYAELCDFSTLVSGYVGYKLNSTDRITFGVQPIPFGPSRYWDSSFYASINNTMGIQDILNMGVNYHGEFNTGTQLDLAYFLKDGGDYSGATKDAARYTANVVRSSSEEQTDLDEKNMWMIRVKQPLSLFSDPNVKLSVGGSYWHSDIENHQNGKTGSRDTWAIFSELNYNNFGLTLTGGDLSLDHKDISKNYSTLGSFDAEYNLANDGKFYTLDARYQLKDVKPNLHITPYAVYSLYDKDSSSNQSERHITGVALDYKNMSLYTEYVWSKNDPFIGGNADSLANGQSEGWNKLLNVMFLYYF